MEEQKDLLREVVHEFVLTNISHRRTVERQLQKTGVYRGQHHMLMYISDHPNRSQVEIAEGMEITPATVAVTIKKLVKEGYIKKQMDDNDNRFNKIELTEKGNRVVKESHWIFGRIDEEMLKGFTKEEIIQLKDYIERIKNNLNSMENINL